MKHTINRPLVLITIPILAAGFSAALFANTNTPPKPQYTTPSIQSQKNIPAIPASTRGQLLYENHCTVCHESNIHIREHRKARSVSDISKWVLLWSQHLNLEWNRTEINDVTEYLNQRYYQFPHRND